MKTNLRTIRKAREIKIVLMSRLTSISEKRLYTLEEERATPHLYEAYLLSSFFDLPVEDIWPNEVHVEEEPAVSYVRSRPYREVHGPLKYVRLEDKIA